MVFNITPNTVYIKKNTSLIVFKKKKHCKNTISIVHLYSRHIVYILYFIKKLICKSHNAKIPFQVCIFLLFVNSQ